MEKMEQILKSSDFSGETDLKTRLRMRLFANDVLSSSDQKVQSSNVRSSEKSSFARELSLDELGQVAAAGDLLQGWKKTSGDDAIKQPPNPLDCTNRLQ